ncbi:MAG: polysaccharide biosynthesis tyrosine autokinase [Clostridia bacterium]|nr:polysaccharide biosynthesis tyrosine autokinase [Clostridia bacterium]
MSKYDNSNKQKGIEINILGYLKELSKRIWIIVLIAVLCAVGGGVLGKVTSTPTYTSSMSFIVNTLTENVMAGSSEVSAQINIANTFKYILSGREMKNAVTEACGGTVPYDVVKNSITVQTVASTNVVEVYVITDDPELSYKIASAFVDNYDDVVSKAYSNAKLVICDRPAKAEKPNNDRTPMIIAIISALAGIFVYCLIIFIMFIVKDTVKSSDELNRKLDLPILGSVQYVEDKNKKVKSLLVVDKKTGFSFIETYKAIRTKIESNSIKTGNKVYVVTSACENEGKSTVSTNIALSLAQNGKAVLLVDSDFRNPSICKLLGVSGIGCGFSDVINGKADINDAIKGVKNFSLYILANERPAANPSELLSTKAAEDIIENVRNQFDYIIIDSAPASVVTDASVIAGYSDAAIMVVREDYAPFSRIRMSIEDIDSNGAEIIGCVFNGDTNGISGVSRYGSKGSRYGSYGAKGKYGKYGKYGYGEYGYGYGEYGYGSSAKKKK